MQLQLQLRYTTHYATLHHSTQGGEPIAPATKKMLRRAKVVPMWGAFSIFTSKRASYHNGVHFFNISTSESAPEMVCF